MGRILAWRCRVNGNGTLRECAESVTFSGGSGATRPLKILGFPASHRNSAAKWRESAGTGHSPIPARECKVDSGGTPGIDPPHR
jgi:hypothetical protein